MQGSIGGRLLALWLLLATAGAAQGRRGSEMWLELPSEGIRVPANTLANVPSADVTSLRVHLLRQPSAVNYGTIYARINTEAANMVMTTLGLAEGIVAEFDLQRRAGFRLHAGRNTVELAYVDQWRQLHYASFVLMLPGKPLEELEETRAPEGVRGQKYAVVVGLSRQARADRMVPLKYGTRDASAFYDYLLSPAGGSFPRENVRLLLDENATTDKLERTLSEAFLNSHPEDMVVLFFSMQAAPDPNDERNFYLLSYDADPDRMAQTAFPLERFEEFSAHQGRARYVVAFADICRTFGLGGAGNGTPTNNLINQYFHRVVGAGGKRAVITASDVAELSSESERWGGGHGAFTWYLLKGLKGEADKNRDDAVTVTELFRYMAHQVPTATGQHPVTEYGLARNVQLARIKVKTPK